MWQEHGGQGLSLEAVYLQTVGPPVRVGRAWAPATVPQLEENWRLQKHVRQGLTQAESDFSKVLGHSLD